MLVLPALLLFAFRPPAEQPSGLRWYDLDTAMRLAKKENKLIWVHVYTDWCAWCKIMEKQAFADPKIADYLNRKYIPVKLNAWSREPIAFDGQQFKWLKEEQCNALAYDLLAGKMEYPTSVIMSAEGEILSPVAGFLDKQMMKKLLIFFGEGAYTHIEWTYFKQNYNY